MSLTSTTREYKSSWWSIVLAPDWFADEEDGCVSFAKDNGVGALQISAFRHDSGTIPQNDLTDFMAGEFPDSVAPQRVICGGFSGVGVDYIADGRFWLKRWLYTGGLLLYVTYNSDAGDCVVESAETAAMLGSLQPSDAT
jgi:hypothetical protein